MLLKLDVIKAFDKLEWPFLLAILRKMGMEGLLTDFLKASFASATSSVLLNGLPTPCFVLKRSVRQGCPLSPLLFIMAFDALNVQLQQAQVNKTIVGVYFLEEDLMTLQNMFAYNPTVVIRVVLEYIQGQSLAYIVAARTRWQHIYLPPQFQLLPWKWEENSYPSPLLGIPIAKSVSMERLEFLLLTNLDQKLQKFRNCHLTLATRIIVVNCLIQSCLGYMLYMWAGDSKFLALLQKGVDLFIWGGHSRVARAVASFPKLEGGLGLLCIPDQYKAITESLMLWVARNDTHPLQLFSIIMFGSSPGSVGVRETYLGWSLHVVIYKGTVLRHG